MNTAVDVCPEVYRLLSPKGAAKQFSFNYHGKQKPPKIHRPKMHLFRQENVYLERCPLIIIMDHNG